ncbi:MAG: DNA N-glycosylase and apurinic/apyrimidinic (AP) lyase [Vezdaea aestivalis]|nr:MAG: DNA N-glycosylase and apurinic/apyrimidinic (AP) lyase [Vezdaea aestivalis]
MKTSRLSRETAALFATLDPNLPARRTRRHPAVNPLPTPPPTLLPTPDIEDVLPTSSLTPSTPRSARKRRAPSSPVSTPRKRIRGRAPPGWEAMYQTLIEMRATTLAPVDTMGCETLALPAIPAIQQRFQTLIALMLSSQTKDTINAVAMRRLQTELPQPGGLCLENILEAQESRINELIWQVGFHNRKAGYIKQAAEVLRDRWKGDIPDSIEGLMSLPGVGPKMAYLCLSAAWGRTEGIGVDVHVHRITNMWGWVDHTKGPEETRVELESWLPKEKWHEINKLLVGLGQTVCLPIGKKCGECRLGEEGHCKAGKWKGKKRGVVKKEAVAVVEGEAGADVVVKEESVEVKLEM